MAEYWTSGHEKRSGDSITVLWMRDLADEYGMGLWGSLLLFRHSAKSENAQDERLAYSPYLPTRAHLSHVRNIDVVILTPETAGIVGIWEVACPYR